MNWSIKQFFEYFLEMNCSKYGNFSWMVVFTNIQHLGMACYYKVNLVEVKNGKNMVEEIDEERDIFVLKNLIEIFLIKLNIKEKRKRC